LLVSILIVVDVPLEAATESPKTRLTDVSILIVVDVPLEVHRNFF
jgi:hypothetical protein